MEAVKENAEQEAKAKLAAQNEEVEAQGEQKTAKENKSDNISCCGSCSG